MRSLKGNRYGGKCALTKLRPLVVGVLEEAESLSVVELLLIFVGI